MGLISMGSQRIYLVHSAKKKLYQFFPLFSPTVILLSLYDWYHSQKKEI